MSALSDLKLEVAQLRAENARLKGAAAKPAAAPAAAPAARRGAKPLPLLGAILVGVAVRLLAPSALGEKGPKAACLLPDLQGNYPAWPPTKMRPTG